MDENRRKWLEEALKGLSVNVIEELCKAMERLAPENVRNPDSNSEEMEEALEVIIDFVDSIDTANDFHKIGGLAVLKPCLLSPHDEVRWRCGELIATLTQNNPYCQDFVLNEGVLPILLQLTENDTCENARIKALYAVSCLIRDHDKSLEAFINADGFSCLLRVLQTDIEKLRIKAAFLLASLCNKDPSVKDLLCKMGFVEQLAALLQKERDSTHEHLLSALLALVQGHERSKVEARRPEFMLKQLLEDRVETLKGHEENEVNLNDLVN
nr:EOG090X0EEI [Eulimnadia texana]